MTTPDGYVVDFQHVALLVSDLARSKQWYSDLLGWQELFTRDMPTDLGDLNGFTGTRGDIAMGEIRGVKVEFVQMHTKAPLRARQHNDGCGMFLLSVRTNDLDVVRARCSDLGVQIVRERLIGQTRTLIVRDPDGQEVALGGPTERSSMILIRGRLAANADGAALRCRAAPFRSSGRSLVEGPAALSSAADVGA